MITDQVGNVIARRDFMPFGEEIYAGVGSRSTSQKYASSGIDNVRQRYTGYQKDGETELDFAEARMYQNKHGRFTTIDPLMSSANLINPQTFNRYTYTGNNPVNNVDPSGLDYYRDKDGNLKWFDNDPGKGWTNVTGTSGTVNMIGPEFAAAGAQVGDTVTLNSNHTITVVPSQQRVMAQAADVLNAAREIIANAASNVATHAASAFMTVAENNGAAQTVNLIAGTEPYDQHTQIGQTGGNLFTLGQGAFEIVQGLTTAGVGGTATGGTLPACATGVGCAIPATTATITAVGIVEAMHGASVISLSVYNMAYNQGPGSRSGNSTLEPGPHSGESIPARSPDRHFNDGERESINKIGNETGCHSCGTKDPGTKSGNFVPDHQPPSKLNPKGKPQRLYPQCLGCSKKQGGQVRGITR